MFRVVARLRTVFFLSRVLRFLSQGPMLPSCLFPNSERLRPPLFTPLFMTSRFWFGSLVQRV